MEMRFAILGRGSLLWDGGSHFDGHHEQWEGEPGAGITVSWPFDKPEMGKFPMKVISYCDGEMLKVFEI